MSIVVSCLEYILWSMMFQLCVGDKSVYVIELLDMSCIQYVSVTQCKDSEEELLSALGGASRWCER